MKRVLLFIIFAVSILYFQKPKVVNAFIGQCCQENSECGNESNPSGNPVYNENCNGPGDTSNCGALSLTTCANYSLNACNPNGSQCFPQNPHCCQGYSCEEVQGVNTCVVQTQGGGDTLVECAGGETGVNTAIGCIPVFNRNEFLSFILTWIIGIAGGIAFLLIIFAGFLITTSAGNPQRLQAGKELLTAALSGLIFLIFSLYILKFIGVDILGLDRFGF
ncbi:hypothetical protein A2686_03360 [Candidatus Woesebacteria bacterium RIFCSPHIGHO2_01_FULL_38_10]|uniref:Uncharacterized protein n=1 Tax=Candidatus Woesebacteria bacterium RIFCSPLOWO2_01_FULL_39_10b TaxID=1802517 RepID=A0A1F8B8J8_9BACT|nr:MAG: hypothetical protein A2686_03360 [Candidatus Woesebacteria bacterium RIFCSPHIGHO2_01_FULL_38_10]OGM60363.1 MAG: hypothetical protein A2892_03430 [Candidatus Woesebacteria bacterium RIFCSPLOWO2_01_FULL_39_10b]